MAITYQGLVGSWEEPEETLRAWFFTKWNPVQTGGKTPIFQSPQGKDNEDASLATERLETAWKDGHDKENMIVFNQRGVAQKRSDTAGNHVIPMIYQIYIDIFAEDTQLAGLFARHINDIIQDNFMIDATPIKKSNGTENSPIVTFEEEQVEFINPHNPQTEFKELWSSVQLSGIIKPVIYKVKTS
jgi:hypothetical protein